MIFITIAIILLTLVVLSILIKSSFQNCLLFKILTIDFHFFDSQTVIYHILLKLIDI